MATIFVRQTDTGEAISHRNLPGREEAWFCKQLQQCKESEKNELE